MKYILPFLVALTTVLGQGVEAKSPVINDVQDFPKGFVRELQDLNKQEELSQKQLQNKLQDLLDEYEIDPKDHRKLLFFDFLDMTMGEALVGAVQLVVDLAMEDEDEATVAEADGGGFLSGLRFRDRTEEEETSAAVAPTNANAETRPVFQVFVRDNEGKNAAKKQAKKKGQGKRRNIRRGI